MGHEEQISGYEVLGVVGYGANSTIYAVKDHDSQRYALKRVVKKDPSDQRFIDQMVNEYKVSAQISHPTVRRCIEMKYKKKALITVQEAYLVMELVEGQNLVERRPPTLGELSRIFLAVADALIAMHQAGFVHADMKPNNIIVNGHDQVKVIDLGQSCPVGTTKHRIQGTPDYIAPEQVKRRPLTPQTDMFNFGATMYWCVTNHHVPTLIPKEDESGRRVREKLRPAIELNPDLPHALNTLIMDCLRTRPIDRPESWKVLRDRLELVSLQLDRDQPTRRESQEKPAPPASKGEGSRRAANPAAAAQASKSSGTPKPASKPLRRPAPVEDTGEIDLDAIFGGQDPSPR